MKFIEFQQRCQSFRTFFIFDNIVLILDPFRKFTSIGNTIDSGLKRRATGSASKRYQTSLFSQLSKILLENLSFELFYPIPNDRNPPSNTTRHRVNLLKEDVSSYFVG